jgi:FtsZ-interacting cell division protein ZipA
VSLVIALTQGQAVAWICFVVGVVVLFGGMAIGLWTSFRQVPQKTTAARAKLEEASARIDEARAHIEESTTAAADSNLESFTASAAEATTSAAAAGRSAEAAKSALEQVQGIVAALPENLRFAGVLILVGTVLMGVATIQFGGVSLF